MIEKNWVQPFALKPLTVHEDARGKLFEALRFTSQNIPSGGQFYIYTVSPGARRGDHFHENKKEWFICVYGRVRLLMKTEEGDKVDEMIDSDIPTIVYAGPGTSHAVINESKLDAVIVAYASKEFDPSNPDTVSKMAN